MKYLHIILILFVSLLLGCASCQKGGEAMVEGEEHIAVSVDEANEPIDSQELKPKHVEEPAAQDRELAHEASAEEGERGIQVEDRSITDDSLPKTGMQLSARPQGASRGDQDIVVTERSLDQPMNVKQKGMPYVEIREKVYEFGKVTAGDTIEHTFWIKNDGDKPLIVKDVMPFCVCTTVKFSSDPVPVGKETYAAVRFYTDGKQGEQYHSFTIVTNARPARYVVMLAGEVK